MQDPLWRGPERPASSGQVLCVNPYESVGSRDRPPSSCVDVITTFLGSRPLISGGRTKSRWSDWGSTRSGCRWRISTDTYCIPTEAVADQKTWRNRGGRGSGARRAWQDELFKIGYCNQLTKILILVYNRCTRIEHLSKQMPPIHCKGSWNVSFSWLYGGKVTAP